MVALPPKKRLGQHFLRSQAVARDILDSLTPRPAYERVVEIGPGQGALTDLLQQELAFPLHLVELDEDLIPWLKKRYAGQQTGQAQVEICHADILATPLTRFGAKPMAILGNLPYYISSQICLKLYKERDQVAQAVIMVQEEVGQRLAAHPGGRTYGRLSVLLQTFFEVSYCFCVPPEVFSPPPKVYSAVLHLARNARRELPCAEKKLQQVVKAAFGQRRKMLRNALKGLGKPLAADPSASCLLDRRAETLSPDEFIALTCALFP